MTATQPSGQSVRVLDEQEAAVTALRWIDDHWRPTWTPAVARMQDVGDYWRVFYSDRALPETGVARASNLPVLVRKSDSAVTKDLTLLRAGHRNRS